MLYEIFKFEIQYRIKRPETYILFCFLFLCSIFGVDFIFQGVELGLMKKNAPLVIAKTMAAITGLFMIMVSMIMGIPILRDHQYNTEALLFVNPISKKDYILGRFLGSFTVLIFIFSGLLFGMMLSELMPWHEESSMLDFQASNYISSFLAVALPSLFFGACLFFVTGMLSKKLFVVYTQGIFLFVIFLLTKAISNEYIQGVLDPFSLSSLTELTKHWTSDELNTTPIHLTGVLLLNKAFWLILGLGILAFGYKRFSFSKLGKQDKRSKVEVSSSTNKYSSDKQLPELRISHGFKSSLTQLFHLSRFYTTYLLKEASFWAIIVCGISIILINSFNLGILYEVDSYPTSYFIVEELKEMSIYFFIILLVFYSGELIWKERTLQQYELNDSTPINSFVVLVSKLIALTNIYLILIFTLIITGVLFQLSKGYYEFALDVYFYGFFVDILPYLILYSIAAFSFQVISKNKFTGILLTLIFFIINIGTEVLGFNHSLYKYGGKPLGIYSEMNAYGHFLKPYLLVKSYWFSFGFLLLILGSLLMNRGQESNLLKRIKSIPNRISQALLLSTIVAFSIFSLLGFYIYYNTNIINTYLTANEELEFRYAYEKTLKPLEYIPQPKITDINLEIELYPEIRTYSAKGKYTLKNTTDKPIQEIHIQKLIASHTELEEIVFEGGATKNDVYERFEYSIFKLDQALLPNQSIQMTFKQSYKPKGFEDDYSNTQFVYNGSFFKNNIFPSIGYNKKYELNDARERAKFSLPPRHDKANITDERELVNARSGSDSDGIKLDITIGTSKDQTAVTSGRLVKQWKANNRNYFRYKTDQMIINLYSVVSANYEIKKDIWHASNNKNNPVDLEIYYHEDHTYNLDRMMKGMKASLDYYHTNFSPYQYDHLRIMEFPRYDEYAQSLPGAIPFSEAMGFILDIDDKQDVDIAFFITAHEVAHQWFGMQVEGANVQGRNFILETLSQYAALMVLKSNYPRQKVEQFLKIQQDEYETGKRKAKSEPSLSRVQNQDYIYYNKGAIAMYKFQEQIGEDKVNAALQAFLNDWDSYKGRLKTKTRHYATADDLLNYFKAEIPEAEQDIIYELFETTNQVDL
jgi:ABC-2 type transport system permease protein